MSQRRISYEVGAVEGEQPKRASEQARMRMLARVPVGYAVEYDPNAPPVAEPLEGLPEGPTGRTYKIAEFAARRGITPENPTGNEPAMARARVGKPPKRVDDVTEITLFLPEKVIKAQGKGGKVYRIELIEPALQDGAVVTFIELEIDRLSAQSREAKDITEARAIGAELYKCQLELLRLLLPDIGRDENEEVIRDLRPSGFRQLADVAKRYVYEVFTDPDVLAQREDEYAQYVASQEQGEPAPN